MNTIPYYEIADANLLPERVFVYRNLHFDAPTYSVRDTKTGRVAAHVGSIVLKQVEFVVGQKGRERVVKEGRKNVHAGFRGTPTNSVLTNEVPLTYNPYKNTTFVERETGNPVLSAPLARLSSTGGHYENS